jgi:uncharacterized membrane protein
MKHINPESLLNRITTLFLHGIFTLLPALLTFALLRFLFHIIKYWLSPIYNAEPALLQSIPHSEIIITLLLILTVGILYDYFLQPIIHYVESSIVKKIPLISLVYFGLKQLTKALTARDKHTLQQVVLVPFPTTGTYSIGFVTNQDSPDWIKPLHANTTYLSVFIPHTPNPTSGFFIVTPADRCIPLSMSRQEAMTLVISGGIVKPHNRETLSK